MPPIKTRHDIRVGKNQKPSTLTGFAEDLGRFLGTVQNRAASWLDERKDIAKQLTQIRDTANQYLQQLSQGAGDLAAAVHRGRTRTSPTRTGRGSKTSASGSRKTSPRKSGRKGTGR
jgi:hypothetical protein